MGIENNGEGRIPRRDLPPEKTEETGDDPEITERRKNYSPEKLKEIDEHRKEVIERRDNIGITDEIIPDKEDMTEAGFEQGEKLDEDYIVTTWLILEALLIRIRDKADYGNDESKRCKFERLFEMLFPLQRYQDYERKYPVDQVERTMDKSDPAAIGENDRLIDEFNADLERIKREKDMGAVEEILARARKIAHWKSNSYES